MQLSLFCAAPEAIDEEQAKKDHTDTEELSQAMIQSWPDDGTASNRYWLLFPEVRILYLLKIQNGICRIGLPLLDQIFEGPNFLDDVWKPFLVAAEGHIRQHHGEAKSTGVTVAWKKEKRIKVILNERARNTPRC